MFFVAAKEKNTPTVDRAALFESLIRSSHRQAYALAYRLTGNAAEAEDLVQESFVRAFRFFHRYDEGLPFTSWLYRIISNVHVDTMRRNGRLRTTSLEHGGTDGATSWDVPDEESCPDRLLIERQMDAPVQQALQEMNPEFRTAVLLADVEGMAYEEVAEIMRTSVGTVRSRIHRGRKQLRDHLVANAPELYRSYQNEL